MTACVWPVARLLPHAGDAILIDAVQDWDAVSVTASAVVRPGTPYSDEDGSLPPWIGLEIMAQAIGAWAGCQALSAGTEAGLGFLLGTRRYDCRVERFLPGTRLDVRAVQSMHDPGGMGIFECELSAGGQRLAHARLNVYRPADGREFTRETAPGGNPPSARPQDQAAP
ncbi:ApeP family dehydratase [Bordetella genomosp. 9]|uniref:3-hydroxylacyl-ACP dehydratase n=1 Tax=Bordetella genomosp. 9 TaxID=1416803 RepID=A0A1W6Z121_9BORD|nr:3-hydroxylacyl-ACP dehydratase [Bordetella genomosp. 9]ARP87067.1 3-hydroxylacyl-ACP dehydratase [Bordetella genomosp. 9]ARP91056.1 3-hydroxylacyl-ACP dehydratase [Bordetella genomosp. 9]